METEHMTGARIEWKKKKKHLRKYVNEMPQNQYKKYENHFAFQSYKIQEKEKEEKMWGVLHRVVPCTTVSGARTVGQPLHRMAWRQYSNMR